ncbi:MFS transporter [Streptomyces tubbatahanensis]|uniref:MFS transporter n=1 Tax=Streptomyces tubbatahanensis TaxID=2923272 RepID=A0ABY3XX21_9ACTN|nr:MFS transporter [Streptomyces tubbatahanensis]UNS99064.1 MFS transporter [Streptomyces tubbatahanensis]
MTETATASAPGRAAGRTPLRSWLAVLSLTGATFSITATEMLPVGLLTPMGGALDVSEGSAGLTVTLMGLTAAVAAPTLPLLAGRVDRRVLLAALMAVMAAANLLSALAPSLLVLLLARVAAGVAHGGVWALAASLAVRLVPAARVGRALSAVFAGIGTASVLAVPAGTMLGQLLDWRAAFLGAAALTALVAVALALALPALPAERAVRPRELAGLRRNAPLRTGMLFLALLVVGHFAAYTYVRPFLEQVSGIAPGLIGVLLLGYGAAGIAGNFAAGTTASRTPRRVLLVLGSGMAVTMAALALLGGHALAAIGVLLLWGVFYGGVSVSSQAYVLATAARTREAAGALFAAVFNASIALGALAGGRVADTAPLPAVLWAGAALAATAVVLLALHPAVRSGSGSGSGARCAARSESAGSPGHGDDVA